METQALHEELFKMKTTRISTYWIVILQLVLDNFCMLFQYFFRW